MDIAAVQAAYDEHMRRGLVPSPGDRREDDGRVVRVVADAADGWHAVVWSDLGDLTSPQVDAVVAAQVERFTAIGSRWEWKWHSYDEPADLPERLVAAGLSRGEDEAVMVADLRELNLDVVVTEGIRLEPVLDAEGAARLVAVHDAVFGGDHSRNGRQVLAGIAADPATSAAVVAMAGDTPVCAGRVELHHGTPFASIWGGGTLPQWRGRGVFRAVVAWRARVAADAGFRWLQVDASPESRPILARMGFAQLAVTVPFEGGGR